MQSSALGIELAKPDQHIELVGGLLGPLGPFRNVESPRVLGAVKEFILKVPWELVSIFELSPKNDQQDARMKDEGLGEQTGLMAAV